ncbi:autotransporter outer membrane beta-barrel domain-containing protein [Devosia sp. SL43]|uniref:autotransporter outer membrane beta-barrel domain-containing protein n=1 Tax=Devosia sp. SL43 TaxID=2806348 RepID=UPI001F285575|nr:autotransporter domain-containing protein [Devosia sp. SL43]UJW86462.1 autotransporter domain-containing protein [Devosia sp. SL43]
MTASITARSPDLFGPRNPARVAGLAVLLVMVGVSGVRADCLPAGGTSFVCSGATTLPQFIVMDDAVVTTTPGFGVDTSIGMPALAIGGNGSLSYFDDNASALVSDDAGLYVENLGAGAGEISVTSNGAITGGGGFMGAATVINSGIGATSVALSGPVNGEAVGLLVGNGNFASTGNVAVTTGTVNAGIIGIYAVNVGAGALEIVATGAVHAGDAGIVALVAPDNIGGVTVNAQSVTAGTGINVANFGLGETRISVAGTATGTDDVGISAEVFDDNNTGGLALDVANASGDFAGISAVNFGLGGTRVTTTGLVTSATGPGLAVWAGNDFNTNEVLVDVNSVTGYEMAILVRNDSAGTSRVTVNGLVEAQNAIIADTISDAAFVLTIDGEVRSTLGVAGLAVDALLSGATTITNNNRLSGRVELSDFGDVLNNAGLWDVDDTSTFGQGSDSVVNQAGATLRTARLAAIAETTRLLDLESFSGGGTVLLADGGVGDTLEMDGNLVFGPGAVQAINFGGAGADKIVVDGAADVTDATLLVNLLPDYVLGQTFAVLSAGGGLTGEFSQVGPSTAYLYLLDSYDANNAYLQVVLSQALGAPGRTLNQIATGTGLESLDLGNPLVVSLLNVPTDDAARAMLAALSGEIHGSVQSALLHDSWLLREAVLAHLRASLDGSSSAPVLGYAGGVETLTWEPALTQIWSEAFGHWGRVASDGNASEMQTRTGGMLAGADSVLGDWRVGMLLGYGATNISVPDLASSADSKSYQAGLYGGTAWGDVAFRGGMAYAWNDISSTRTAVTGGGIQNLTANYGTSVAQAFAELAYTADFGSTMLEPFANVAVVGSQSPGYAEQGGTAALSAPASSNVAAFTTLGLRAAAKFIVGETTLVTVTAAAGWRQGFGSAPQVQNALAGGAGFSIAGPSISGSAVVLDAGLEVEFSEQFRLGASYNSVIGAAQFDQSIKGSLTVRF